MTKKLRVSPGAECKRRVAAIRDRLPKNVRQLLTASHREYDSAEGLILINNVLSGRSQDLKLTEILEAIAKEGGNNEA